MTISDWINLAIAIGTVGSCVVAIWLAYDSKREKLECVFVWRKKENYIPTLSINNICDKTIIVESIKFKYGKKKTLVGEIDFTIDSKYSEHSIVEAHSKNEICLNNHTLFHKIKLDMNDDRKKKLYIVVKSTNGKTFKSSFNYSDSDIFFLFMCEGAFGNS